MHAAWNLLSRRHHSEMAFFSKMLLLIITIGFFPVAISEIVTRSLTMKAWCCLAGSGMCCGVYLYGLARAYESSDFTIVYPVARSLPVLLVGLGDVLRGRYLTQAGWLGLVLVTLGCFLTPLKSFRQFNFRVYFHHSSLWMLLAAMGTVGYTLFDKMAAEVILPGPATAARYGYVFFSIAGMSFFGLRRITHYHRQETYSFDWKMTTIGTLCFFGAYWLILWAYQISSHASYIVAFRQFSIIIGVILAFVLFKEQGIVVRITGAVSITAGLLLVGIFGS